MIRGVSQIKKRGKKPSVMAFMTASQPNCKNTYTYVNWRSWAGLRAGAT
jgi:hypothetical protein